MEKKTVTAPPVKPDEIRLVNARELDAKFRYLDQLVALQVAKPDSLVYKLRIEVVCDSIEKDLVL